MKAAQLQQVHVQETLICHTPNVLCELLRIACEVSRNECRELELCPVVTGGLSAHAHHHGTSRLWIQGARPPLKRVLQLLEAHDLPSHTVGAAEVLQADLRG